MKLPVYMDNHATTPVDPRVLDAMMPYFKDRFGNVGSGHLCGRDVRQPVVTARKQMADLIGADPCEIVFTSGATESDNLAIKGVAWANRDKGRHIITCVTEHKAVLDTCKYLDDKGFDVTFLPVNEHGQITLEDVKAAVRLGPEGSSDRTILVTLMGANNEIGTIHPFAEIGKFLRSHGIIFHVDAAQTAGKIPFNVKDACIDLASFSAHKMYGPKGIGALYVRQCEPKIDIELQMHGGGQEYGIRSGTLAVPMIVALGKAAELAREELQEEIVHLRTLRDRLQNGICSQLSHVKVNGHPSERVPGNLSLTFKDLDGEMLMLSLKDICCSATSACSAAAAEPSYVLRAIGLTDDEAFASIRFGVGRFNTEEEIAYVIQKVVDTVTRLRVGTGAPAVNVKMSERGI